MGNEFDKREDLFEQRADCPLCGTTVSSSRHLFDVEQLDLRVGIRECSECGLAYKEQVPTSDFFSNIYSSSYIHHQQGSQMPEPEPYDRVSRMGIPDGLRHLDYGCGGGGLVREAILRGWDSYGVDPYLPEPLVGDQRFFRTNPDSGVRVPVAPFDVISLWAVVEHLDRPMTAFTWLASQLNDNGRMIFNVPNASSLIARKSGANWHIALLLEHTIFFTGKTVAWLARRIGLRVEKMIVCGSPYPLGKVSPSMAAFGLPPRDEKTNDKLSDIRWTNGNALKGLVRNPVCNRFLRSAIHWLRLGDHYYVVYGKGR